MSASSSELSDARYLGGLEQRVFAAEARLGVLEIKMDANHKENVARLDRLQGTLDRQDGGIRMLRVIGTAMLAVPGWGLWAVSLWRRP